MFICLTFSLIHFGKSFPSDPARRKLWLQAVRRSQKSCTLSLWEPSNSHRLCSLHFLKEDYLHGNRLKPHSVPSVFFFNKNATSRKLPQKLEAVRAAVISKDEANQMIWTNLVMVLHFYPFFHVLPNYKF